MRLIDADALKQYATGGVTSVGLLTLAEIDNAPTIDPASLRPKGEWKYDEVEMEWSCSECLRAAPIGMNAYILTDFCPNCGADMRGTDNG